MAFDLSTAKPVSSGGFDLSTAKPVGSPKYNDVPSNFGQEDYSATSPQPEQSSSNIFKKAIGADETALQYGTSIAAAIPAALAGGWNIATNGKFGSPEGVREASKAFGDMQDRFTYSPRTEAGRSISGGIGDAISRTGIEGVAPMSELGAIAASRPALSDMPGVNALGSAASKVGQAVTDTRQAVANKLMQSAVKPTIAQLRTGDAKVTVDTLLREGINPTKGGVNKLREMIDGLNDQITGRINNSNAMLNKSDVMKSLDDVRSNFADQVSPTADLNAIDTAAEDFKNHPAYPGDLMTVQDAQKLKQGTYRVLAKKYGQIGSADTEAQKGLARGLKEGIADAVPDVAELNAKESKLLTTLSVTERRALMDMNKNPMGLAALAHNPLSWAAFMADKSALFKSLVARMINPSQPNKLAAVQSNLGPFQSYPLLENYAPQLLPPAFANSPNAVNQPR